MKRSLILAAALLVSLCAGWAWKERSASRDAERILAVVAGEDAATNTAIREAESRRATAETESAKLRTLLAARQKTSDHLAPGATVRAAGPTSVEELQRKLEASRAALPNAAQQAQQLAARRANLVRDYRPFFEKLRLTADQIDRFVEINLTRTATNTDLALLVKQGVIAEDDPVFRQLKAEVKMKQDAAYRALLGDAGFEQLLDWWATEVARQMVCNFAGTGVTLGAPAFTAAQLEQLVAIVAKADSGYRLGGRVSYDQDTVDWNLVELQARPLMTDSQWWVFKNAASTLGYCWSWSRVQTAVAQAAQVDAGKNNGPVVKWPRN